MFFRKRYDFQINQNKDALTQTLKDLKSIEQNEIGGKSSYSVEFSWDEFIITRKAKMFERSSFTPDAYVRLESLSENLTQIDVKIKLSEIWWILLIFIHLGIIAGFLLTPSLRFFGNPIESNWWSRILFMIGVSLVWNFIIWLIFIQGSNVLKKVVKELFEQVTHKP